MKNIRLFALALIMLGFILAAFQIRKNKVTGTWNLSVETPAGSGTPVLVLKQENDTLITGTYTGLFGEASLKGTIKENQVDIVIPIQGEKMEIKGTIDGDAMKGKIIYSVAEIGEGTFSGQRKK